MKKIIYIVQLEFLGEYAFIAAVRGSEDLDIEAAFRQKHPRASFPRISLVRKFLEGFCKENNCTILETREVIIQERG